MIRSSILAGGIVLSLMLTAACNNNAADDQVKANNAQAEANAKVDEAQAEANAKMNVAQAGADKKIAEAQASFMRLREDYRHTTTTSLVALDKKIADIEARAKTASGKERTDLDGTLRLIHAGRDRFATDFKAIEAASTSTWDGAKASLDQELADVQALADNA
jgi:regulator of protease activity HflC (stomatin/prohibitin superfamily)